MLRDATSADTPLLATWMDDDADEWVGDANWVTENVDGALIYERDGQPAAFALVELDEGDATVTVVVDPAQRGNGVGTAAIRALIDRYTPEYTLWAEISWRNGASEAAFTKAGFSEYERDHEVGHSYWIGPSYPAAAVA